MLYYLCYFKQTQAVLVSFSASKIALSTNLIYNKLYEFSDHFSPFQLLSIFFHFPKSSQPTNSTHLQPLNHFKHLLSQYTSSLTSHASLNLFLFFSFSIGDITMHRTGHWLVINLYKPRIQSSTSVSLFLSCCAMSYCSRFKAYCHKET